MKTRKFLAVLWLLLLTSVFLFWGIGTSPAQMSPASEGTDVATGQDYMQKSLPERRLDALQRLDQALKERSLNAKGLKVDPEDAGTKTPLPDPTDPALPPKTAPGTLPTGVNPLVDITLPNYAYSPNLRKFVDALAGLGAAAANALGQYIPVAVADTTTYPGSEYYWIAVVQYREQMHSDLPPVVGASKTDPAATGGTLLRGYVQLNPDGTFMTEPHYLGPIILAKKGIPVRVKFTNLLPTGQGGNLFLPVDKNIMGAGMGRLDMPGMPGMKEDYTQNRAVLHLHGGLTPWISDGTPHQWITPAGEMTVYPKGDAVYDVPDMPTPGAGSQTYFWPSEQSARLMFYHDHAYGLTRLNVYAGEAAGFLLTDKVEDDLIDGTNGTGGNPPIAPATTPAPILPNLGGLYRYGIPLVIQDKTFVTTAQTPPGPGFPAPTYTPTALTAAVDPRWLDHLPNSKGGHLWFPHEYIPNENLYDPTGFNLLGRWDYGPWILPPMFPLHDVLPSPSHVPESFMDTMVVNGTVFPYVELPPTAVRFRILNACNDRMLNLSLLQV